MKNSKGKTAFLIILGMIGSLGACNWGPPKTQPPIQNQPIIQRGSATPAAAQRDPRVLWQQFDQYMRESRFEEAIQEANRLLIQLPNYAKGYNNRGVAYWITGKYEQAIADFNKAISLDPQDATFYCNRGGVYLGIGELGPAEADYNQALRINPASAGAYYGLGRLQSRNGAYDAAIGYYDKAISLASDSSYYRDRALAYAAQGKFDEALSDINTCIRANSRADTYYTDRAYYYWMKGVADMALQDAERAIEINSNNADAYATQGSARWMKGQKAQAVEDLKTSIKLKSTHSGNYLFLGYFTHNQGQRAEALGYFSRAFDLDPEILQHTRSRKNLTDAPSVRRFYEDVAQVAALYQGGKQPAHDYEMREEETTGDEYVEADISVTIESVTIQPNPVAPGGKFDLVVEYRVDNPLVAAEKVAVQFGYAILQEGSSLFAKKPFAVQSFNGRPTRRTEHVTASQTKGAYTIEVTVSCSGRTDTKIANLRIEQ
jgi:tetratricopeptide (TPR) repeat protein